MAFVTKPPLEAAEYIYTESKKDQNLHVEIINEKITEVAKMILGALADGSIADIDYKANPLHPDSSTLTKDHFMNWILFVDALNFSFWPDEGEQYYIEYKGERHHGYQAFCAAVKREFEDNGTPIYDAEWMKNVTEAELGRILKSDSGHDIPMLKERVNILHETGDALIRQCGTYIFGCLRKAENKAQNFLRIVNMHMHHFRDCAMFKREKVAFLKRLQILTSDIYYGCKEMYNYANFTDIETITMFADYRVPQVLAFLGVFKYSEHLMKKLQAKELIPHGDLLEVQIRGCSIWACELIKREIVRLRNEGYSGMDWSDKRQIYAVDVDVWLWQYRREHADAVEEFVPHHRTRSIFY